MAVLHIYPLGAQELDAGPSIPSATPIMPQQRSRADYQRVEQHTHLARFFGGVALPLTRLAERTRTATADAGRIHHPQASIGFPTSFVDRERLPCRAAQRPIWLLGKLSTREATGFPGQRHLWWPISLWGRRDVGHLFVRRRAGRSELGGAHRIRMKLMAQFQAEIPDPLRHDLPALLPTGGLTTPTVWVLLNILIGKNGFKSAAMQIQFHDVGGREALLRPTGEEEFVDDAFSRDANPALLFACRMSCHHHAAMDALRPDWHIRAVVEAAHD